LRKVLGASSFSITRLLSRDFTWLLVIAFALALPAGYYLTSSWLSTFAYRTALGAGVFVITAVLNALLALAIVAFQGLRASGQNPATTLKNE
jgi:putative ABC transport system permease protein